MKHTPEPWKVGAILDDVDSSDGKLIAAVYPCEDSLSEIRQANASRIVACVNACAGMEDPAKELFKLHTERQAMQHTIDLLQKKNAELKTELANVRKERNALYIRLKSKRP